MFPLHSRVGFQILRFAMYACATYADLADGDEIEVLDSEDVNNDELWN